MISVRWMAVVGIGLVALVSETSARANAAVDGDEWWQWALAEAIPQNPMLDTTGADCAVNQHGNVWFLAGTFGGGMVTRLCTISKNKQLFFPIINSVNIDTPNVCGQGPQSIPVDTLRAASKAFIDGATNVSAEIDGRPIPFERLTSPIFTVTLPAHSVFEPLCIGLGGVPAGRYHPAVDEGYYASVDDLSPGQHTLHLHADDPSNGFSQDVTYQLTVK
jgi:hypothetical protein